MWAGVYGDVGSASEKKWQQDEDMRAEQENTTNKQEKDLLVYKEQSR